MEAVSSSVFMHYATEEQACWLEELQDLTNCGFVVNSIRIILNIFV